MTIRNLTVENVQNDEFSVLYFAYASNIELYNITLKNYVGSNAVSSPFIIPNVVASTSFIVDGLTIEDSNLRSSGLFKNYGSYESCIFRNLNFTNVLSSSGSDIIVIENVKDIELSSFIFQNVSMSDTDNDSGSIIHLSSIDLNSSETTQTYKVCTLNLSSRTSQSRRQQ